MKTTKTIPDTKFVMPEPPKPTWDVKGLSGLVCCEPKHKPILDILATLDAQDAKQFKKELLAASGLEKFSKNLEDQFDAKIDGDENEVL